MVGVLRGHHVGVQGVRLLHVGRGHAGHVVDFCTGKKKFVTVEKNILSAIKIRTYCSKNIGMFIGSYIL